MKELIAILQKIAANPKVLGYIVVILSSVINKKIAMEEAEKTAGSAVPAHTISEPLFLPRGTVRATLALVLLIGSMVDFAMASWSLPNEFHAMTILAVGYYIGYRSDNARTKEIKD